jgi:hypothetical protein
MTFETMKELFGIAHVRDDEEEVPNMKRMHVGEEEVSLSQLITVVVPPEEEKVQVLRGPTVVAHQRKKSHWRKRRSQPPMSQCHHRAHHCGPTGGRSYPGPLVMVPPEEMEVPAPLSRSHQKEGDALSQSMIMASMMKALYRPW